MIMFLLGISISVNFLLGFLVYKIKDEKELKEAVVDEECYKDFSKSNKPSFDKFFNSNK